MEPEIVSTKAKLASSHIDRFMTADFQFANGSIGRITSSIFSRHLFRMSVSVYSDEGEMHVLNPYHPHWFHRLRVQGRNGSFAEKSRAKAVMSGAASFRSRRHETRAIDYRRG